MQPSSLDITQEIRIFISSTFRDMQEERDELIKHIFPQLKQICLERGVFFTDIDLRWGITEEQAQKDEVIPICLNEIDNSRPFFIGILGDRYGWIPDQLQEELLLRYPWLQNYEKISVTEMEIRHGVLNNPSTASHALFYFRAPSFYERIPVDKKHIYQDQDPEAVHKLKSLKQELEEKGISIHKNYKTPKELGSKILQDLTRIIQQEIPENPLLKKRVALYQEIMGKEEEPRGTPVEYFLKQQTVQKPFIDSLRKSFTARSIYYEVLDDFMGGQHSVLVLHGPKGSGKSALIINWLDSKRKQHPEQCISSYHAGYGYSNTLDKALLQISWELKEAYNLDLVLTTFNKGFEIFPKVLKQIDEMGGALVVLDGLDRLRDKELALKLDWIPRNLPSKSKLITSLTTDDPLDLNSKANWISKEVSGLTRSEQDHLIIDYLGKYGKRLSDAQLSRISDSSQVKNPLYLKTFLDELRIFGIYEELDAKINDFLEAKNTAELYQKVFIRLEKDFSRKDKNIAILTLKVLGCGGEGGFSEDELRGIIDIAPLEWSLFYNGVNELLINRLGTICFRDEDLRTLVHQRYLSSKQEIVGTHSQIARYFQEQPKNSRNAEKLPWHLFRAEKWEDLKNCLLDMELFYMFSNEDMVEYWKILEKFYNPEAEYLAIANKINGVDWGDLMNLQAISRFLNFAGYKSSAEVIIRKIITLCEENEKSDSLNMSTALTDLAILLDESDRIEEAELIYNRVANLKEDAYTLANLGTFYVQQKNYEDAEQYYLKALAIIEANPKTYSNIYPDISIGMANLLQETSRHEEAEVYYRRAVDLKKNATTLKILADYLFKTNRNQEAENLYREVLNIADIEEDSTIIALTSNELGTILFEKNDFDQADLLFQRALTLLEQNNSTENATFAHILLNLAELNHRVNRLNKSESLFRRALNIYENIFGKKHSKVADILNRLGLLLVELHRYQEAEPLYERSLSIYMDDFGNEDPNVAKILCNIATLYSYTKRHKEAEKNYRRALIIYEKSVGPNHPNIATILSGLGIQLKNRQQYEKAEESYKRALRIFEDIYGKNHITVASVLLNLGSLYVDIKRYQDAKRLYTRALDFYEATYGPDHSMVAKALMGLALISKNFENFKEAEYYTRRAINIFEKNYGNGHFSLCSRLLTLSEILYETNQTPEAINVLKRALLIAESPENQDKQIIYKIKDKIKKIEDA